LATTPLIGGCAPLRIEFLSAATFPSLFEKGGAENDAGFKTQSVRGALAVGKRARRRKVMNDHLSMFLRSLRAESAN
jgi:hypothetical protein